MLVVIGGIQFDVRHKEQSQIRLGFNRPTAVSTPFIGSPTADGQHFGAVEDILIAVIESCCDSPVPGGVSTLYLRGDGIEPSSRNSDLTVQEAVSYGCKRYIYVLNGRERVHARVRTLDTPLRIARVLFDTAHALQSSFAQEGFVQLKRHIPHGVTRMQMTQCR